VTIVEKVKLKKNNEGIDRTLRLGTKLPLRLSVNSYLNCCSGEDASIKQLTNSLDIQLTCLASHSPAA
jgi:hypothetical protein